MENILVIDDDVTFGLMLKTLLEKHQYRVDTVCTLTDVLKLVKERFYDVVLTDLRMPDISGIDLIRPIKQNSPGTRIIMMTGYADIASAIQSIKRGAFNYIPKPFQPEEVLSMIREATTKEPEANPESGNNQVHKNDFLDGVSKVSKRLKHHIRLVAPTPMSVLITGESGTGKEYIARSIHKQSARSGKPFIAVDCGAIPSELVASEFFGHLKGSFTGAIADKTGHFEAANGGTLFLDEVGNLSYNTQIQLLRALQERTIKPVGSSRELHVDVRIIAATNEDLTEGQENGTFRKDLFHRLNEFQINVPPVRDRREDIMLFARHFLVQANVYLNKSVEGFSPEVETAFLNYDWPGNLREMKNVVKRATLLSVGSRIGMDEIPVEIWQMQRKNNNMGLYNGENEMELIRKALKTSGYNKSEAARLLKIDRKTLYNKLKQYQMEVPVKNGVQRPI